MKSENSGEIRLFLRLEGALVALTGLYLYAQFNANWWLFAALILIPDISFAGYLKGAKFGAHCYNIAHTYIAPAIIWGLLTIFGTPLADAFALIWVIHIGIDRLLGYGLKYPDAFKHTHLSNLQ